MADIKNFGIVGVGSDVQFGKGGGTFKWDTDGFISTSNGTTLADLDAATMNFTGLSGTGAVTVTDILDEDNMASDSATALATQQSIKAYVDSQVGATTLTGTGDSGAFSVDLDDDTFGVFGGTNLTSTGTGSNVTVALDADISLTSVTATGTIQGGSLTDGTATITGGSLTGGVGATFSGTVDAGTVEFDNLSGTGAVTVTDILDDDTMATASATTLATSESIKAYVDSVATEADLDFQGDSGTGTIDLDSQILDIAGGFNLNTVASGQTLTVDMNAEISLTNVSVTNTLQGGYITDGFATLSSGSLTGAVNGTFSGTIDAGTVEFDNLSGTGAVSVTDILDDDTMATASATTLATSESIKAYVDAVATAADLDIAGDSGTGSVDLDSQTLNVDGGTGMTSTASGQTITMDLDDTGVAAGDFGSATQIPTFTVNAQGQLTQASNVSIQTAWTLTGDTGSEVVNGGDTVLVAGGTNITTAASATDTLTVNLDSDISLTSVTATGTVQGGSLTDGTATLTAGSITNAVNGTFSGTVSAGTVSFSNLTGTGSISVTDIIDDDTMATASASTLATSESIKAYVDSTVGDVDTLSIAGDSGSGTVDLATQAFTVAGGTNLTSVTVNQTTTVSLDSAINLTSVTATGTISGGTLTDGTASINSRLRHPR